MTSMSMSACPVKYLHEVIVVVSQVALCGLLLLCGITYFVKRTGMIEVLVAVLAFRRLWMLSIV